MKLVDVLVQAGYDYRKDPGDFLSPTSHQWLKGGEALREFYQTHFPDQRAEIGEEDPSASVKIVDKGHKLELVRKKRNIRDIRS